LHTVVNANLMTTLRKFYYSDFSSNVFTNISVSNDYVAMTIDKNNQILYWVLNLFVSVTKVFVIHLLTHHTPEMDEFNFNQSA